MLRLLELGGYVSKTELKFTNFALKRVGFRRMEPILFILTLPKIKGISSDLSKEFLDKRIRNIRRTFMGNASKPFMRNFDSLEDFVDVVSEVLNCPITVEDANHHLLAYSKHDEKTDPARISTIIRRKVPENVINMLWKNNIIPTLLSSKRPLRIKEISEVGLGNRIAISIRKNEEILGFIWVLDQKQNIDDQDLDYLVEASKVAKNLLLKIQTKINKKQKDQQEIFRMLLNGHFMDERKAIMQFEQLGIRPPSTYSIIIFRFQNWISDSFHKQLIYVMETIQKLNIIFYQIEDHDFIILVASKTKQPTIELQDYIETFVYKMKERFQIDGLQYGFGSIYHNLQFIHACFSEAEAVLELKGIFPNELLNVYGYHQLGLFKHIKSIAPSYQKPEPIIILEDYDRKNNSELLVTLESYLDHDLNISETAKHLHIHINTLNYRLKRMAEIAQINFKDFNEKAELYLSLKLYKYLKNTQPIS